MANMFTFSLTFIRHGETQHNRDRLIQGQGVDTVLSETGLQQAEAAGRYLGELRFHNVFVSDLQRARQTAEAILRNSTHCSDVEMVLEPLLRERAYGKAEGLSTEELKNMANANANGQKRRRDYTPPGGETLDQVRLRFEKFLEVLSQRLVDEHGWDTGLRRDIVPEVAAAAAVYHHNPDPCSDNALPAGLPTDGLGGVRIHALVVSHGVYIREAIRHLVEDLHCSLPPGLKTHQAFAPCPNTGISRFVVTLTRAEGNVGGPSLLLSSGRCVFTNRKEHLAKLKDLQ